MSLLVEYSIQDGKAAEQVEALQKFTGGLKALGESGFQYAAFETDDPTRFIAVFEFDDDAAKQQFLSSKAFEEYRDGSKGRFTGPPSTTEIRLVASTRV